MQFIFLLQNEEEHDAMYNTSKIFYDDWGNAKSFDRKTELASILALDPGDVKGK
jgi:hypothetical protein